MAVLIAIVATALVLPIQASAAGPVTGTIEALGVTAQQQLAAVAQDTAAAVPLPPPSVPAVTATKDVTPTVDAVPQTVAKTVTDVASSANDGSEHSGAGEPGESARSESSDARSHAPAAPTLPAADRAEHATPSARPSPTGPTHVLGVTREIVAANAKPLARSLAQATQTLQRTPAGRDLGERASHIAGALIGTVTGVATVAREALLAVPVAVGAPLLQTPNASPASMQPSAGVTTTPAAPLSPSEGQALGTAAGGTIGSAGLATAPAGSAIAWPPLYSATTGSRLAPSMRVRTPAPGPGDPTHFARLSIPSSGPHATALSANAAASSPQLQMPGGAAPVSGAGAAGGLSGLALLTLAALLLLAAPRAMRRLRLAAGSWRAAQFILIPERPG